MNERSWDRLAELSLNVESYRLEPIRRFFPPSFKRHVTLVALRGNGDEGIGEDVVYDEADQLAFQRWSHEIPLSGRFTLAELSERLESTELFPRPPQQAAYRHYRRWAVESAALDLALRQAGRSLAGVLGLEPRPVRFVVSLGLGNPPSLEPIRRLLERDPGIGFKLDAASSWTASLIRDLAATGAVETVDFKGAYHGAPVDLPTDARLYARVAETLTDAWLEDPALTPQTGPVLADHRDRITWDAPIHSVADIRTLPFPPRMLNIKPSRFGSIPRLLDAYDHCRARSIAMYGGGQFEIGPGRGQIQYLASLFHPDSPNDVAPTAYNLVPRPPGLPGSPLEPRPSPTGFRWTRSDSPTEE